MTAAGPTPPTACFRRAMRPMLRRLQPPSALPPSSAHRGGPRPSNTRPRTANGIPKLPKAAIAPRPMSRRATERRFRSERNLCAKPVEEGTAPGRQSQRAGNVARHDTSPFPQMHEDRFGKRTREMRNALGPVVAEPAMRGAGRLEIDAFRLAPRKPALCCVAGPPVDLDEPAPNERVAKRDSELAREMTIATAQLAQFIDDLPARAAAALRLRREIGEAFDQRRNLVVHDPVISEPALREHREHPRVHELLQVRARTLRRYAGNRRQFAGRHRLAAIKRADDCLARGI